jgi:phenylalanyl-tRNA synthetase beta chain
VRVLLSWLKEFVDIKGVEPEKIAERLNFAGVSVEDLKKLTPSFKGVITARILDVRPHPNADKLRLAYIDYGKGTIEVVCGADNIKPGQIVPYAPVGSSLKNGELVLEARRIRGVLSPGMLCSEVELDLGEDASGIFILSDEFGENIPLGIDLAGFMGLEEDWLFEFELPSNRPDLYSVIGIAREISAIFSLPFNVRDPELEENKIPVSNFVKVVVEDEDLCPRYTAKAVINVKNRKSPFYIRHRLLNSGIRTISAVVDVSNYVMLETGQPLHTFDRRLIEEGTIVVRRAKPGEIITTLDGVERRLNDGMLLIADPKKPVAIAGIMGSENSEVSFETSDVIIESAHFDPKNIMRTSRLLGLMTEASSRFEKRVDPEGTVFAARRTAQLIKSICGGEVAEGEVDVYAKRDFRKSVKVRHARIESVIGKSFSESEIRRIFTGLGFSFNEKEGTYEVEVPSFRADLEREIDFIEEVARIDGYDLVPDRLPENNTEGRYSENLSLIRKIRESAIRLGFSEAITNPLIPESYINLFLLNGTEFSSVRRIVNPLSLDMSVLTPLLSINLLQVVRNNYVRFNKNIRIFELGKVFRDSRGVLPDERYVFAAAVTGDSIEKKWWSSPVENDIFDLKGAIETAFKGVDFEYTPSDLPFFKKGKQAEIFAGGKRAGFIGEFKAEILKQLDIDTPVFAVELELEPVSGMLSSEKKFRPIPLYPPISYDLSFIVSSGVKYGEIKRAIEAMNLKHLESVEIFDLYQGRGIDKGKKSMSVRIVFRAEDRTLSEEEVRNYFDEIIEMLKRDFSAEIRGAV